MTPLELGAVLLQFALFLAAGWPLGGLIARALGDANAEAGDEGLGSVEYSFGAPERILFTLVGGVAWAVFLMLAHMATGGVVFGTPLIVPSATAALLLWEGLRHRRDRIESGSIRRLFADVDLRLVGLAACVLIVLYVLPMVLSGSPVRTGDSPWHLGWTEQLLAGDRVPTGPAPEFAHNAYPWGFHAVLATITRLLPGSDPLGALAAVHLVIVLGVPIAAAVLARRVVRSAGWPAAAATSVIGGFGWMLAGGPEFSTTPAGGRAGADLVVASPNSVYELFPPPLPREVGLVLLAAAGAMLLLSGGSGKRTPSVVAGGAIGLVGLVSVPMFVGGIAWMLAAAWMGRDGAGDRGGRVARLGLLGLPAVLVFAAWAAPVAVDYARFGGFVDITPRLGREWALPAALASWGLLVPLAVAGVVYSRRHHPDHSRLLLALGAGTTVLLVVAIARGIFDWDLYGNATVLHQGRVWPPAHLLGGVFAGLGTLALFRAVATRSPSLARGIVAGSVALGSLSPIFATIDLTGTMRAGRAGFVYAEPDIVDADSFVQRAAARLGPDDAVSVELSHDLAFLLFQFSGARLIGYDNPALEGNDLRIRFREPARRWQAVSDRDGYEADYRVLPADEVAGGPVLASGRFDGRTWVLIEE